MFASREGKTPGVPWAASFHPATLDVPTLLVLTRALTELNVLFLLEHPDTPRLYAAGIRYEREPDRGNFERWWHVIPWIRQAGVSDCKGLAAWRAAELIVAGERARALPFQVGPGRFHVVVERGNGTQEDPSYALGM